VNKESLPLIFAIIIPVFLVSIILLYIYGYDLTKIFRDIDFLYYIIIFPIILGFVIAISRWKKNSKKI
jgi:hypothetical protein